MTRDIVRELGLLCLGTRMKRIGERLQSDTQAILDAFGGDLVAGHCPFLAALDRLGPITVGDLADAVGVAQPGATRAVKQMIAAGLIESGIAEDDRRRRIIRLTVAGEAAVAFAERELWPRVAAAVADLCANLSGDLEPQLAAIEDTLAARPLIDRIPAP